MKLSDVGSALIEQNKESLGNSAKRRAGRIFNERLAQVVVPKLPIMVRAYADQAWFKYALANTVAGLIIKFGYTNDKLIAVSEAAVDAAADDFLGAMNLEEIVNELLDGIEIPGTNTAVGGE